MSSDPIDIKLTKRLNDHSGEMLLAVDAATLIIVLTNAQACRLLGYPCDKLTGMQIELVEAGLTGMFYWQDVLSGYIQPLENAESEFLRADGSLMTIEKAVSAYQLGGRQFVLISAKDITQRLNDENRLAALSVRLKSILESTADGILAVSDAGEIEGMNHRFASMWDIPPELCASDDDLALLDKLFCSVKNSGMLRDFFNNTEDGEHDATVTLNNGKIFELRSCPQQALMGRVFSCNDITARVQAESEAMAAKAEADRANQAKGAFLASMSHEIRTPMNAIVGLSQLALNRDVPVEVRDYLEKINISSESLLGILNDILDFSKIEAGMLSIENTSFNLDTLLNTLSNLFSARAGEKQLELTVETPPDMPVQLIGDALRIGQVLSNLLGNAIKFTARGYVALQIQVQEAGAAQVKIRFAVSDSGIGMSQEDQLALFKPFSQADTSITRRFGGTGLGLAISHQLVKLMGGEFQVKSKLGQGSTFSFELTLALAPYDAGHKVPFQAEKRKAGDLGNMLRKQGELLSGIRILVVEDNRINQQIVKEFLQLSGVIVDLANDGRAALAQLAVQDYAAVLMDVNMPVMGGVEATLEIRRQEIFAALPVIALTAGVTQIERERCLACGMNDFVSKPVNPQELIKVLSAWLGSERHNIDAIVPAVIKPEHEVLNDLPGFDMRQLREILDDDNELIIELLHTLRDSLQGKMSDLEGYLKRQDYKGAHALTHNIKGMAGNMGATELYQVTTVLDGLFSSGGSDPVVCERFMQVLQETQATLEGI